MKGGDKRRNDKAEKMGWIGNVAFGLGRMVAQRETIVRVSTSANFDRTYVVVGEAVQRTAANAMPDPDSDPRSAIHRLLSLRRICGQC